jgi:outer membrane protein TolC
MHQRTDVTLKLFDMSHKIQILLTIMIILVSRIDCFSQDLPSPDVINDGAEFAIPPLNALIDSAILHNPYVKFRDNQILINEAKLKMNQTQWTRNIGFQTDIRYGTFNNFNNSTTGGQTPDINSTLTTEFNYGVGAYIRLPFDEIFNHKNLIKSSKSEVEQASNMAAVQRQELRQLVIKQYNELMLKVKLFQIKSKYLETSRINVAMAEKEFKNGTIPITEYSRVSEMLSIAETEYQTVKAEYNNAYMILEDIVGFKLNSDNSKMKTH